MLVNLLFDEHLPKIVPSPIVSLLLVKPPAGMKKHIKQKSMERLYIKGMQMTQKYVGKRKIYRFTSVENNATFKSW
jgi:hypothetical protein